jgi:hypothetical protein
VTTGRCFTWNAGSREAQQVQEQWIDAADGVRLIAAAAGAFEAPNRNAVSVLLIHALRQKLATKNVIDTRSGESYLVHHARTPRIALFGKQISVKSPGRTPRWVESLR